MSATLNDKIRDAIENNTRKETIENWYTYDEVDVTGATNEIEKLILKREIELMEQLAPEIKSSKHTNPFIYQDVIKKHSELTNQLKALT